MDAADEVAVTDESWRAMPPSPADTVAALFSAHHRRLVGLGYLLLADRQAAEDIVQDAFIGLYRQWTSLRDPDAAVAYLNQAVVNGGRSELRRTRRAVLRQLQLVPRSEALESAEREAMGHDESDQLWRAVTRLPRRQRQVLVLRYYLDQSETEIATTLGLSCGTVKTHASRGLTALARCLEDGQ